MATPRKSTRRNQRQARDRRSKTKRSAGGRARRRVATDPQQRKVRNRIVLTLGVLVAINGWVFGDIDATLESLGGLREAAVAGAGGGALPALAEPREDACGGDPVRIFAGLDDLHMLEAALTGRYTLRLALLRLGIASKQIDRVEAAMRARFNLELLGGSGAPVRVAVDRHGTLHALELEIAEGHVLQACRRGGEFEARNLQHRLRSEIAVVHLELGGDADLVRAVEDQEEHRQLAAAVARTLAGDLDFMVDARPGDRIDVVVEKRWLGPGFHRYGQIFAIRLRANAARASYYRFKPRGRAQGLFDRDGRPLRTEHLRSPVGFFAVAPEARGLLPPRVEVVEGRLGAVYRLPEGAPLLAIADGKIRESSATVEDGNVVDVEASDGTIVRYAHLLRTVGELEPGTPVRQGQVIALAGHSGRTPNDRVRIEIWRDVAGVMQTVDPIAFLAEDDSASEPGAAIPDEQAAAFAEAVRTWDAAIARGAVD